MKSLLTILLLTSIYANAYEIRGFSDPNQHEAWLYIVDINGVLVNGGETITKDPNEHLARQRCPVCCDPHFDCELVWLEDDAVTDPNGFMRVTGDISMDPIEHMVEGSGGDYVACLATAPHHARERYYYGESFLSVEYLIFEWGNNIFPDGVYIFPENDELPRGWIFNGAPTFDIIGFCMAWLSDDEEWDINYDGVVNFIDFAILN